MKSPADDLAARAPVWEAMSELYLDTDTALSLDATAQTFAASPYRIAELRDILVYEVNPVLWRNVYSVAGIWQGFRQDELRDEILRRQRHPRWWRRLAPQPVLRHEWRAIVPRVDALRFDVAHAARHSALPDESV
jgi:hypothetical protein